MGYPDTCFNQRNLEIVAFSGTGAGTSTLTSTKGAGVTCARTGVGVFTLTLTGLAATKTTLVAGIANVVGDATALQAEVTGPSSGVLTVTVRSGTTETDPSTSYKVHVLAVLA